MKIFTFFCFVVLFLSIAESQQSYYDVTENKSHWNIREKIVFPGKSSADELNLSPSSNNLANNFVHEKNSNNIHDEDGSEDQPAVVAYNHRQILFLNVSKNKQITGSNDHTKTVIDSTTKTPSLLKRIIEKIRNSSEDINERETKLFLSNQRTSNQTNGRIPPPSVMSSTSGKSVLRVCEIKYAEYIQRIFPQETDTARDANDEELNGRILAAPGEYPHMTALGFRSNNGKMDYQCGGSLISEKFVITAAHCTNFTGLEPTKVRIGDLNLMVEESYLQPQIRSIKTIYVHPEYKKSSYYNDIALLELDIGVELTEFVRPIRLWTKEKLPFATAYAMGYGATDFARERTNRLTNLNMTIVPNDECNREMPKFPETERGIVSSQICARDYALNRDICHGDSGGPLQLNIRGKRSVNRLHYQLIGITSYGLHCRSSYPSIFTRVFSYLDWIERIAWRDYFD